MIKRKKSKRAAITSMFLFIAVLFIAGILVSCINKTNNKVIEESEIIKDQLDPKEKEEKKYNPDYSQDKDIEENQDIHEKDTEESQDINEKDEKNREDKPPEGSDTKDNIDSTVNTSSLSNKTYGWSFKRNSNYTPVTGYTNGIDLEKYNAYYRVDTEEKVIYLTFDEGYENGYTEKILDILLENDVKAAFFVTKPYIDSNVSLCVRMKEEGHVIGNHSVTHRSFPDLSNTEIEEELVKTNQAFLDNTGYELDPFFRTPSGNYSERVLNEIKNNGYSSVFWSLAYLDWDVNKQPGKQYVYDHIMTNHHSGGIFLLHAVSESNTEALDDVLKALKAEGYRFGSLYELD